MSKAVGGKMFFRKYYHVIFDKIQAEIENKCKQAIEKKIAGLTLEEFQIDSCKSSILQYNKRV